MYLKNGLIKFLKVKNVILLILGVFLVSSSVAIITQLIVGYFGDWFTILHARAFPESVFLIIIGIVLIVCSRISRRLINDAVFFSGYFEGDLNGYVDFAELAEVTGKTTEQIRSRVQLSLSRDYRALQQNNYLLLPELRRLDGKARVF